MPALPLLFRARCGSFVAVFIAFMFRRARKKAELQCRTLRVRNRLDGVIVGLTLSVILFSNLLMQCGDIESNPGPPKPANTRQTRLSSSSGSGRTGSLSLDSNASGSGDRGQNDSDSSLKDMMAEMMVGINARFDQLQNDIREAAIDQKKRATMIYDHLLIDGKKYVLGDDDNGIVEVS
ncbi:hypothetical protein ACOMHN_013348 [Nucella lapillus]